MAITIDKHCAFYKQGGRMVSKWLFFGPETYVPETYTFRVRYRGASYGWNRGISKPELHNFQIQQVDVPVHLISVGQRNWWWYRDIFYRTSEARRDPAFIARLIAEMGERSSQGKRRRTADAPRQPESSRPKGGDTSGAHAPSKHGPHEVLGVSRGASWDEIKSAYRKRIAEYHPDKVESLGIEIKKLAGDMTVRINEAYATLRRLHE